MFLKSHYDNYEWITFEHFFSFLNNSILTRIISKKSATWPFNSSLLWHISMEDISLDMYHRINHPTLDLYFVYGLLLAQRDRCNYFKRFTLGKLYNIQEYRDETMGYKSIWTWSVVWRGGFFRNFTVAFHRRLIILPHG